MKQKREGADKQMEVREFLERARYINMEIDSKLEHVTALRHLACKVNNTFSETPPSGTPDPKRMENVIIRFVDLEKEVDETIDHLVDIKGSIMKAIRELNDPKERIVLELRYLAFKDWPEIAEKMKLQPRRVYQIHQDALAHLDLLETNQPDCTKLQ
jgi:DNA-directed RNA polymerase specialized sigma subunit